MAGADRIIPGQLYPWIEGELPEPEVDNFAVDFESGGEVVEDSGFVVFGEFVLGVA